MITLAVETSSRYLGIAVVDKENLLYKNIIHSKSGHSPVLIPFIENALRISEIKLSDIELIGVDIGPGSFTGIRIGLSVVKGMCFTLNKPVKGVSSLRVLSEYIRGSVFICPMIEAIGGVFGCLYYRQKDNNIEILLEEGFYNLDDFLKAVKEKTNKRNIFFIGNASIKYKSIIFNLFDKNFTFLERDFSVPDPYYLAQLSLMEFELRGSDDIVSLKPLYLKPPYTDMSHKKV